MFKTRFLFNIYRMKQLKPLPNFRHSTDREVALMILMAYLSYVMADVSFLFHMFQCFMKLLPLLFLMVCHVTSMSTTIVLQLFQLSGILTMFFCGIVMSHYTWHNITESSRVTTKYVDSSEVVSQTSKCNLFLVLYTFCFPEGMLLRHCLLYQRLSSSSMLVWMPWTWRSGRLQSEGNINVKLRIVQLSRIFPSHLYL